MGDAQVMAFLHQKAASKRQRATKREPAIAPRRFWRTDIFPGGDAFHHRGMFCSFLIHVVLLSALLASPVPPPWSAGVAESDLIPIDSRISAPAFRNASISLQMETPPICCGPQAILSDPPNPTNRVQTILRPDFPNAPSLEEFIPPPNMLTLERLPWPLRARFGANVALQTAPLPVPGASSPDAEQAQGGGDDAHDTLALGVLPAPPSEAASPPVAESRGRFAEKALGGVPAESGASEPAASSGAARRAEMVFAGIAIQGGEWKAGSRLAERVDAGPRRNELDRSSYALTVASSGNGGGGIRDFGIFGDESVFTHYFDVSAPGESPAPPWVLQYAFIPSCCDPQDAIVPPLPVKEPMPAWPQDLVTSYSGETIVIYVVIAEDGKLRDARVLESPSSQLSSGLLEALDEWIFQPAERNGRPCAIKALLGIPVATYR